MFFICSYVRFPRFTRLSIGGRGDAVNALKLSIEIGSGQKPAILFDDFDLAVGGKQCFGRRLYSAVIDILRDIQTGRLIDRL